MNAPVVDCAVIGGGLAGMVAARRLQQLGVGAVVLEKGEAEGGFGNAAISGGILHVAWEPPDAPAEVKLRRLHAETDGEIDPLLADAFAERSGEIVPWLLDEGVEMAPKGDASFTRWALSPHRSGGAARLDPELGPGRMMRLLHARFGANGGRLHLGATARSLSPSALGRWTIRFRQGSSEPELTARSVLIADGGFQGNSEMLSRYVGPNAGLCLLRAAPTGTGDGLRMLIDAGADVVGLGRVYGHILSHGALSSDELWPFPHMDDLCLRGLLLSRAGERFPVDTTNAVGLVTRLARSEDPRGFSAVFDAPMWDRTAEGNQLRLPTAKAELVARGGELLSSESIAGLAEYLGISADRLQGAVDRHNATPGASQLATPPFYAARVVPGITFTMGGAKVGPDAGVRDQGGGWIPGLFAAGSTAGGIQGGPNGGYVGGLAAAATFGLIAAEGIARHLQTGSG